jgi:hypothetical protein
MLASRMDSHGAWTRGSAAMWATAATPAQARSMAARSLTLPTATSWGVPGTGAGAPVLRAAAAAPACASGTVLW